VILRLYSQVNQLSNHTVRRFLERIVLGKLINMKNTIARLAGMLALSLFVHSTYAQFTGKLVYEIDRPDTKLVMTYYQKGTQGHIEAYNVKMSNGTADMSTLHPQDTVLWDFAKGTETHLNYHQMRAFMTKYIGKMESDAIAAHGQNMSTVTVTSKGSESVNGYACTHYVMTMGTKIFKSTRDVWITKDLGPAPTVYVVGSYLYFTPGFPHFTDLTQAGADGVVVKAVLSGAGMVSTMNLISVDKKTPSASLFQAPSRYTLIDETNMTIPQGRKN
jgi:Domain of unknown function (DUF4412)